LYRLKDLKHDLGVKFGKDKYFEDDALFSVITDLTYPEIGPFFANYVEGTQPIPYEQYFGYAGIKVIPPAADDKSKAAKLVMNPDATPDQIALRNIWLKRFDNQPVQYN